MKRSAALTGSLLMMALLGTPASVAFAQDDDPPADCAAALAVFLDARADLDALPETIPNEDLAALEKAVTDGQAALDAAAAKVVMYNPNVYPDDKVPAVEDVTPELLKKILEDPDLGGGARAEVEAALAAFDALAEAQDALAAAPETIPNPDLISGPVFDAVVAAQAAADVACEGQPGDPGPPGADGDDGADGTDGTAGTPGTGGTDGDDGKDGVNGKDGADGRNGLDGLDGANGRDGSQVFVIPNGAPETGGGPVS